MKLSITHLTATPVVVPSRPDSIMSPEIVDDWSKAAAIGKTGGGSTGKIAEIPKYILRAHCDTGSGGGSGGVEGIGETYRMVEMANLISGAKALSAQARINLADIQLSRLPLPYNREYDAFELLVYDLVGKALGVPVYQLLGGRCRDRVECSMWTGRRTPEDAGRKAHEGLLRGFDTIKFKCNDQDDVAAWAREVRRRCGDKVQMIFDPNQRWGDVPTAKRIMLSLEGFNVLGIEDPIKRSDLAGFRALRGVGGQKVVVHVALPYAHDGQRAEDALEALRQDACDAFNFNGGMAAFVRLADMIALADKPCWHGSEVDLGILEAGYVHSAAASPACTWPSDIFGRLVREHDLLAEPLVFEGKFIKVPEGPGLGVRLDEAAVEKYRAGEDVRLV